MANETNSRTRRLYALFAVLSTVGAGLAAAAPANPKGLAAAEDRRGLSLQQQGSYTRSREVWRKAAAAGSTAAMYGLGCSYARGLGTVVNLRKAVGWYKRAAAGGYPDAMFRLGLLYEGGRGVKSDFGKAARWYAMDVESSGSFRALGRIALLWHDKRSAAAARKGALGWLRKKATSGNANAMYGMGWLCLHGVLLHADDSRALAWYQKAAAVGNWHAMIGIARIYWAGLGVKKDAKMALSWYRRAAATGSRFAESFIGDTYMMGFFGKPDYKAAKKWEMRAAMQGNARAMADLGLIYAYGLGGVRRDLPTAKKWLFGAALAGCRTAQREFGGLSLHVAQQSELAGEQAALPMLAQLCGVPARNRGATGGTGPGSGSGR